MTASSRLHLAAVLAVAEKAVVATRLVAEKEKASKATKAVKQARKAARRLVNRKVSRSTSPIPKDSTIGVLKDHRFAGDTIHLKAVKSRAATCTTIARSAGALVTVQGAMLAKRSELSNRPWQAGAVNISAAMYQYNDKRRIIQGRSSQTQIFMETLAAFC